MPTDLTKTPDNPVLIVERMAAENGDTIGAKVTRFIADTLREVERRRGATFVALDTEALDCVRKDYERVRANVSSPAMPTEVRDLIASIGDLLGLED